jgi:hypothetical protein
MTAFHLRQPDDVVTRPDATEPTATPEELPLFAVMAVYQDADFPGADQTGWDGGGGARTARLRLLSRARRARGGTPPPG